MSKMALVLAVFFCFALVLGGCGADKVADKMTGKSDIEQGERAKKQLRQIDKDHQKKMDEAMGKTGKGEDDDE